MPQYCINGITIEFPYEAYDIQIKYMEKVICALQERKHALLESPTGTGKTLCLLCASLAWRQHQATLHKAPATCAGDRPLPLPPIVYSSRTHSQLSQAMREIKKTKYKVKATVLGSRQQQCCHPKLKDQQGTVKNNSCLRLIKAKNCLWHAKLVEYEAPEMVSSYAGKVLDIEDLAEMGKKKSGPCPYFFSRKMAEICDIVFLPYNYLIDKQTRQGLETLFVWSGSIVIFDEAHNIEKFCAEAASFDLNLNTIEYSVLELERARKISNRYLTEKGGSNKRPSRLQSWEAFQIKASTQINMLKSLESHVRSMKLPHSGSQSFPGDHIFKIFSAACITDGNWKILLDILKDAAEILVDDSTPSDQKVASSSLSGNSCGLVADAIEKAFDSQEYKATKAYRVHVQHEKTSSGMKKMILSYWCFSPAIAMRNFISQFQIRSIVLTSGTLSPLDSFAAEFKMEFPIQIENKHLISENQVLIHSVSSGPTGSALDSSFKHRNETKYKEDLGLAIIQFLRITPGGVLMFFPSYVVLENCLEYWKTCRRGRTTLWQEIIQIKGIVVEPQNPALFPSTIKDYKQKIDRNPTKGCILFAVCRGKVSEGIDFSDHAARAVIIAGIPYAPLTDPRIQLKREYLNQEKSSLTGNKWYTQSATRAVNQAIGRVIRHKNDYGAILLCDRRFSDQGTQNQLSKWVLNFLLRDQAFNQTLTALQTFFKQAASESKPASLTQPSSSVSLNPTETSLDISSPRMKRSSIKTNEGPSSASKKQRKECAIDLTEGQDQDNKEAEKKDQESVRNHEEIQKQEETEDKEEIKIKGETQIKERDTDCNYETSFSKNPKQFMVQVKQILSEETYAKFRVLLADLKSTRDVQSFQDSLIELMSQEDQTRSLLPGFIFFLPKHHQANFLARIQQDKT